jgi:hypothetical protein
MSETFDVMQVCENGHKITDCYKNNLEERSNFCCECGAATLTACPSCGKNIDGALQKIEMRPRSVSEARNSLSVGSQKMIRSIPAEVPKYCKYCGKPYPWTEKKIQNAIQFLMESGELNSQEKETIGQDVENITKEVPETKLSANKLKRILERCKNISIELFLEISSRTAAKIFKGQ